MSRHPRREKPGKVEMAEAVSAEKVVKTFGWKYAVVYDFGNYEAVYNVYGVRSNAENDAERLNAERGEGSKLYKVAPIRGVSAPK